MDVGFLGLGRMGRAMAANLVKAGHTVRVWNRSPGAAQGIEGAIPVATAAEAFRGDAPVHKGYGALIAEDRYEPPGFTLRLGAMDIRLVLAAAETAGVTMPFASVLRDNLIDAISHGDGDLDFAALATVAARRSGRS